MATFDVFHKSQIFGQPLVGPLGRLHGTTVRKATRDAMDCYPAPAGYVNVKFWLGTHQPHWLARTGVPLMVSARRLRGRRLMPVAIGPWTLDSGGFSELSLFGKWTVTAEQYAAEVQRWQRDVVRLEWAAIQDWMCEPFILEKTGLTIREHQDRTVASYRDLLNLAPDVPWMPVLQGWQHDDYLYHKAMYEADGVDLAALPVVGLGSVCRRQDTAMAEGLIRELHSLGIKVHAFGFKRKGIARCRQWLASADSMAWSFAARRKPPLPGCTHKSCANCIRFALAWHNRLMRSLDHPVQRFLFT